jgi:hypothetical protein
VDTYDFPGFAIDRQPNPLFIKIFPYKRPQLGTLDREPASGLFLTWTSREDKLSAVFFATIQLFSQSIETVVDKIFGITVRAVHDEEN